MNQKVRIAISTCPNDTFAFHALMNRKVDWDGLEFEIELLDISELNSGLFEGRFDVAKASFHAALFLSDKIVVLPSGSAMGFGVGPLVLSREIVRPDSQFFDADRESRKPIVLSPGRFTTAELLFQLFYGSDFEIRRVVFSDIMPMLKSFEGDFGICIHEGRFTWREQGLHCVSDLGIQWEEATGVALPLGGIVALRQLGHELLSKIQQVIRSSIEYGLAHRDETLPTMRRFAQEFSDEVLMAHVDLYVNQSTVELGSDGIQSLELMQDMAARSGLVATDVERIEIFTGGS